MPSPRLLRCCSPYRNIVPLKQPRARHRGLILTIRFMSLSSVDKFPPTEHSDSRLVSRSPVNTTRNRKMSGFSNADTGTKHSDPYLEKNLDNPSLKDKVQDLSAFIDKHKFCMFTTRTKDGLLASRCMALAATEGNGIDAIFHTNTESGKTDDLTADEHINIAFVTPSGEWASISGNAEIITDRELVHKYYSPALKAWMGDLGDGKHDGGPDDPRIGLIKVKATTAQYAISAGNIFSTTLELAKGLATGEAPKVNKLRHITEAELQQWRAL